jgi:hypothetical protein
MPAFAACGSTRGATLTFADDVTILDAEGGRHLEHCRDFVVREVGVEGHVVRRQSDTRGVELRADLPEVVDCLRIEAPLPHRFTPADSLDRRNRVLRLDMSGPELAMREPDRLDSGDHVVERAVTEAVALRTEADARNARGRLRHSQQPP